jgi:hypothetical protein
MDAKTLTTPAIFYTFLVALPEESINASSRDYGFDFDEEELARELLAPLPAASAAPTFPAVEADEFEKAFHYFIS